MAVPEVNKKFLSELEEMGFPLAHATRALHASGNSNLDAAVNWLFDHQNDANIYQMPLVPRNIHIESVDFTEVTEGVRLKALELRDRANRKKDRDEKKLPREREKERRKEGKELLEAKRTLEENERIRFITKRKADAEQLERDRERIRQKLQQDKAERRRKRGLPLEEPSIVKHKATPQLGMKKSFLNESASTRMSVPRTKEELMRDCLRSIKINHMNDGFSVRRAFQTLMVYVTNVVKNPHEQKFRKIRLGNPAFQETVGRMEEGIKFLELCGFERVDEGKFMFLDADKVDMPALVSAGMLLSSALTNPYFGLLSK